MPASYRPGRFMAAIAAAVMSMAVVLVGCARSSSGGASTVSAQTAPQAGSQAEAAAFARHLLARMLFPAGAQPVSPSDLLSSLRDPWTSLAGSSAPGAVDLGRHDAISQSPAAAEEYFLTHMPNGADSTGTGRQNGSSGIAERDLYIHIGSLPRGINDAEIVILMAPQGATSTLISTYVHVIWFPSRTAGEYLDASDLKAVSIRAILLNPKLHYITRAFKSPEDVAALAGLLNSFTAAPPVMRTCPSGVATFQITFQPRSVQAPNVTATTNGCYSATITTAGIPQPALLDPRNALAVTAAHMLGVSGSDT
jgi:hypothetical protein